MKKIIIIFTITLAVISTTYAQEVVTETTEKVTASSTQEPIVVQEKNPLSKRLFFGFRGGLNVSTLSFSEVYGAIKNDQNTFSRYNADLGMGSKAGFHIGVLAEYKVSDKLFLEGGIAYSKQGAKWKKITMTFIGTPPTINGTQLPYSISGDVKDASFILHQINIPLWLKYDISYFRPKVGLNFGYVASIASKISQNNLSMAMSEDLDNSFDFGMGFGMEYNVPSGIFFDINYIIGLSNLSDADSVTQVKFKNRVLQLGVGYKF